MLTDNKGKEVSAERFAEVERRWQAYWKEYEEMFPDADGADYQDERECFIMSELGGNFKHF